MNARLACVLVLVIGLAFARTAVTDPAAAPSAIDVARADRLFVRGRALMARGNVVAAIAALEASDGLDPGNGTRVNLAICYAKVGRLGSALRYYREVEAVAARRHDGSLRRIAARGAAAIEPRVPWLVVRISDADEDRDGIAVTLDGAAQAPASWGAIPVDAGEHAVMVSAPERRPYVTRVTVAAGIAVTVDVPTLERSGEAPRVAFDAGSSIPPVRPPSASRPPSRQLDAPARPSRRLIVPVVGGIGAAVTAGGLAVGGYAFREHGRAVALGCHFDNGECPRADGQRHADASRRWALRSTIAVATGGAAIATAIVLYLRPAKERATMTPVMVDRGAALVVTGRF